MTYPADVDTDWLNAALGTHVPSLQHPADAWRASGCAALSASTESDPPQCDPPQAALNAVGFADRVAHSIMRSSMLLGRTVAVDGPAFLAQRALHTPARWTEASSRNGTTRFIRSTDGWVSFTISRADDTDLLSACFEADFPPSLELWSQIARLSASHSSAHIRERATLLGLSCAVLGEHRSSPLTSAHVRHVAGRDTASTTEGRTPPNGFTVLDLSALWAGPLCAHLLHQAGGDVTYVEDPTRPDGTRVGAPAFFDALHSGHRSLQIDLRSAAGQRQLTDRLNEADVVITSARPRAFQQMGIDPLAVMTANPVQAWISISGFGAAQPHRVGFGDDTAIAGGLFGGTTQQPTFIGDAIADPLTGMTGAAIALHAIVTARRVHVDLPLAAVAALAAQ